MLSPIFAFASRSIVFGRMTAAESPTFMIFLFIYYNDIIMGCFVK